MTHIALTSFDYGDVQVQGQCEVHATRIRTLMRRSVENVAEIGRHLEQVYQLLDRSRPKFLEWLECQFGWSEQTATNYRGLARAVEQHPVLMECTELTLVYDFANWEPDLQQRIVAERALCWEEAAPIVDGWRREVWTEDMERHLANGHVKRATRVGDVLHWTQEAMNDPVLGEAATEMYERHRDLFAAYAARPATEMDAETLKEKKDKPAPEGHGARFNYDNRTLWVGYWDGSEFSPVAEAEITLLCNGGIPIVVFPKLDGGAQDRAMRLAAQRGIAKELGLKTLQEQYGEVI